MAMGEDGNNGSHGQVCPNNRILVVSVEILTVNRENCAFKCREETNMRQSPNINLKMMPFMDGH